MRSINFLQCFGEVPGDRLPAPEIPEDGGIRNSCLMLAAGSEAPEPYREVGFMALIASAFPVGYSSVLAIVNPSQNA